MIGMKGKGFDERFKKKSTREKEDVSEEAGGARAGRGRGMKSWRVRGPNRT